MTDESADQADAAAGKRFSGRLLALPGVLILVVLLGAGYWLTTRTQQTTAATPTLVVLSLHPADSAPDDHILAEELSEELTTRLARIGGLRLISQTSALRVQAEKWGLNDLDERLHVTHALQVSLRQSGQRLRIDLRLSEVPDGRTLWVQTYDRSVADIFAIEHEIAQAVAAALALAPGVGDTESASTDPQLYLDYLRARHLGDRPERTSSIQMLRALIAKAPDYARAHASLARILAGNLHPAPIAADEFNEASQQAARASELDPNLADTQTALAILACRTADWPRCIDSFRRALALDPADSDARATYAYWLAGLGYIDEALHQVEIAWTSDPLGYNANFARARVLDTLGRHDEAQGYLESATPASAGLVYAQWHNAIWRQDLSAARKFAAAMPQSDGFRESYAGVTEALADPTRWSQVQPMIGTSERASGRINTLRIMMSNPDFSVELAGLEKMLRDGWPSYYLLLWMPEYVAMRSDPAFQEFLKRTRLLDYWRSSSWPPQCHAAGDGARCD